ncbi:MAG: tRNA lysidine(34) synthetase TilS [Bacteroidetes bacterium HGW-Bacteroidetes-17]|jgi:tRNA(Ile)-lysidine synthase|nr:MAG: tRNA lysidine(34) synthetase TilS [Bacteroidetes bacterium HGW-Bacteroidetes-17]
MLDKIKAFIIKNKLFTTGDKILLTVSGGMDSVAMCELFHQVGLKFGIAHCNFKLRGEESDGDAQFVKKLAAKYKAPFFYIEFNTNQIAGERGISTQMAARDLRYEWFEKIRQENNYQRIATGHHQDDQLETFFINLLRGTGISGLHGIKAEQGKLIRPLLFTTRKEIAFFIEKSQLSYREDSSNASDKYLRNKIRHHLLPVLEDIDPAYLDIFDANMKRFSEAEEIYAAQINQTRKRLLLKNQDEYTISIRELENLHPISTYLFELIREFGFSFQTTEDIIKSLNNESGSQFFSDTHRLLKDRTQLLIRTLKKETEKAFLISDGTKKTEKPICLNFSSFAKDSTFEFSTEKHIASLDLGKLIFPLSIRKWKEGDYFYPLGSNFKKKISDYFIDQKFSLFEKEDCWLLCSGDAIVWIIGHQIDNRFKISSKTTKFIQIEYSAE